MIWNKPVVNVQKPCSNCYITEITANMYTRDGQVANLHNGLWLHHMVLLVSNGTKNDPTCPSTIQKVAIGRGRAERLWASGNERTRVEVGGVNGTHGYQVTNADQFHLIIDLMNQNEAPTQVQIGLTYKWVTGGVRNVQPLWLDAAGCRASEVPARTGKYTVKTQPYRSGFAGQLLAMGGHIHDGGTNMTIEKNGQVICDSVAGYGETPEFQAPGGGGHEHGGGGGGHAHAESISSMSKCTNVGTLRVGDTLSGTAYYDDSQHAQMEHGNQLHTVMAIALVYVGL